MGAPALVFCECFSFSLLILTELTGFVKKHAQKHVPCLLLIICLFVLPESLRLFYGLPDRLQVLKG